jgi:hypothetical protein
MVVGGQEIEAGFLHALRVRADHGRVIADLCLREDGPEFQTLAV